MAATGSAGPKWPGADEGEGDGAGGLLGTGDGAGGVLGSEDGAGGLLGSDDGAGGSLGVVDGFGGVWLLAWLGLCEELAFASLPPDPPPGLLPFESDPESSIQLGT